MNATRTRGNGRRRAKRPASLVLAAVLTGRVLATRTFAALPLEVASDPARAAVTGGTR